ncbi:hypothetical protein AALK94_15445 [Bacteroides faecichinchillae]|uniref:hypothetical protein n=1 Tax=Bacteroides faecichinchillae TaxID=871325 RepID=UPI003513FCE9
METKNENQSNRIKLKEITQPSPDTQNYSYGSCGSCGCGCRSGLGTGPDDCMSQDLLLELSDRGALTSEVYVCGWGWTLPGGTIYGSCGSCGSCGCGSGSGTGPDDCMPQDLFLELNDRGGTSVCMRLGMDITWRNNLWLLRLWLWSYFRRTSLISGKRI